MFEKKCSLKSIWNYFSFSMHNIQKYKYVKPNIAMRI